MESGAILFSLMFFVASCIYLYLGAYIIKINPKERVNQAFLVLSVAVFLWSFGYALNNAAPNIETALFWRRVASVGRISLFGAILQFMLLLTQKRDEFTEKWVMLLLYVPSLLLIYVFSISKTMAPLQYNLMQTAYGWVDKPVINIWNQLFYFYFISYMLASLGIAYRWKKKLKDQAVNKQANLIIKAIISAVFFGGLLDIVPSLILEQPMPQLTSIAILIPVYAMYYAVRHYDAFSAETFNEEEIIVTSEEETNIFKNISFGFYTAAILTFISEYIPYMGEEHVFKYALVKASIILSLGIIIQLIQNLEKENRKNILTTTILIISVPIALFLFIEDGSVTVWAFTMILIISSTIFSKRILLFSITIISIIVQILIWILRPETIVVVDKYDFIFRIGMLVVAFLIALSTNKIYVSKIEDNKNKMAFQKIVSEISLEFLNLNQKNFNSKVNHLLEEIGVFFHVDRTYLFTIDHEKQTMTYSNEWCNQAIKAEVGTIEEMPLDVFPWWIEQLETNKMVYIEDVNEMVPEAINEHNQLLRQGVKSLVSVPIMGNNRIQAFIGIDSVLEKKVWSCENIDMLNIMANILSNGIMQVKADRQIETMAYYDNLTGLPNRFLFEDRVESAIRLAERNERIVSIMFIDLDDFKSVNDTMGHDAGDSLLKEVAHQLSKATRKTDTVSRFGGDEFILLLNNIENFEDISSIADNVMAVFSKPFTIKGEELFITASGGIATYTIDGKDSETLVKNADMAMYEAKARGKNQYSFCTPDMKDEVESNMKLSNDLYRALERKEFSIYYQPQINLKTKEITGLEALLRWNHPEYGMISPGIFIPLAEQNGLINEIGKWVLKTACTQTKKWQDMGFEDLTIAINLSGIQFVNQHLVTDVEDALEQSKLDSKYLELEITESITIEETDFVISVFDKFKEIGVSIAIDDFGIEYSSLSRLKNLPIDRIKIDMVFIQGIEKSKKDRAVTVVIINLAKSLGMNVLAEGVETAGQLDFLKKQKCDHVQGYYVYKPMPTHETEEILKNLYDKGSEVLNEHLEIKFNGPN